MGLPEAAEGILIKVQGQRPQEKQEPEWRRVGILGQASAIFYSADSMAM